MQIKDLLKDPKVKYFRNKNAHVGMYIVRDIDGTFIITYATGNTGEDAGYKDANRSTLLKSESDQWIDVTADVVKKFENIKSQELKLEERQQKIDELTLQARSKLAHAINEDKSGLTYGLLTEWLSKVLKVAVDLNTWVAKHATIEEVDNFLAHVDNNKPAIHKTGPDGNLQVS